MDKPLLNDPDTFPAEDILADVLKSCFPVYETFMDKVTRKPFELSPVWRYYKDGGAWLCKVIFKKKTVFWLSVWDGSFKTTFYFTERSGAGLAELDVDQKLKDIFHNSALIGKLKPLTISFISMEQINDALRIVEYKKSIK